MPRKKASGFYRDEEGKTRPITSKNVGSALARGIVIKRVVSSEGEEIRKKSEAELEAEREALKQPPSGLFGPLDMAFLRLAGVKKDSAEGYYIISPSESTPGKEYKTVYWTENTSRFHPGDISCNCQGWIFSKKTPKSCKHTDRLHSLFYEAHNRYMQKGSPKLKPSPDPVFFTGTRKDSRIHAKFEKVFPNSREMGSAVLNDSNDMALVLDPHTITLCPEVFKGKVDTSYFEEIPPTIMVGNLGPSGALAKNARLSDVDVLILPRNTMIAKSKLRDILKVLGWTKIYIFERNPSNEAVVVSNNDGYSFVIAPIIGVDDRGYTKLGDLAK